MVNFRFGFFCLLVGIMLLVPPTIILVSYAQNNISVKAVKSDRSLGNSEGSTEGAAETIFQNKLITLGINVKNVIILIPNEGHESPALPEEQREINQPYVRENIIVNPGTKITWLNGDVGHEHTITLNDENSDKVYSSGKFDFNTVSIPLVLNKTGKFTYSKANVNVDDSKFVMEGTVTIKDAISALQNITTEKVGFFMIPEKALTNIFQN